MAYRRKHSMSKTATFQEFRSTPVVAAEEPSAAAPPPSPTPSLAAQAIRASAAHRDASSLSSAYDDSAFREPAHHHLNRSSQESNAYQYTSMRSLNEPNEPRHGFWAVLAKKAKSLLEDDNADEDHVRNLSQMFDSSTGGQSYQSSWPPESSRRTESPPPYRGSDFASSLNHIGGTIRKSLEEGLTIVENRTADIIQETRKLQIRRKGSGSSAQNLATDTFAPIEPSQIQTDQETQLKASRDVANAMAAKAKLLLRELKTVKADLAFAKQRCAQLEEENKILRESRVKGAHPEDEDLIRLQLETLLAEKGRLTHENSIYARENRFLREIVEYHQLTMQDVVYLDEGIEEVTEVYNRLSQSSPSRSFPELPSVLPYPTSPTRDTSSPASPRPRAPSRSPTPPVPLPRSVSDAVAAAAVDPKRQRSPTPPA